MACELIEIIFDFRFNNLVTETVSFYKDLEHENLEAIKDVHNISPSLLSKYESQTTPLLLCAQIWEEKMSKILAESSEEKADNMKGAINLLIPLMV